MDGQKLHPVKGIEPKMKKDREAKKPLPASPADFLASDYPASAYVEALISRKTKTLDEIEREQCIQLVKDDPKLLSRIAELTRASLNIFEASRIKLAVIELASYIIRIQDDSLENWSRLSGSTAEAELGKLAENLNKARQSDDKDIIQQAEYVFQIGFSIIISRGDFSVIGALSEVYSHLVKKRDVNKTADPDDLAKRALRRGQIKSLEGYSIINAVVSEKLSSVSQQLGAATEQLVDLQGRVRDQREQIEKHRQTIETLKAEKQQLADSLEDTREQISGVAGGRDADLNALRARFRRLLSGNLSEFVTQAHEALTLKPPAPEIAEVLLDDARKAISKELEWLRQFLV